MDKENAECGLVDHDIGNHYASESPLLLLTFSLVEVRAQKQMNARRILVEIDPICSVHRSGKSNTMLMSLEFGTPFTCAEYYCESRGSGPFKLALHG